MTKRKCRKTVPRVLTKSPPYGVDKRRVDRFCPELAGCDWLPVLIAGLRPEDALWLMRRVLVDPHCVMATSTDCDKDDLYTHMDECWFLFRVGAVKSIAEFYEKQLPKLKAHLLRHYKEEITDRHISLAFNPLHSRATYQLFCDHALVL